MSSDRETSCRSGGPNETEDLLVAVERLARPVFGDLGEKAMLDGVPLGRARGIVGHGEGEAKGIGQLGLEFGFPGATPAAIAAARVAEEQQAAGMGIARAPPSCCHQRAIARAAKAGVSCETPTVTHPRLASMS